MSAHELDHVAFAVPSWDAAGKLLHRELGARFASGFTTPFFNPCQLALAGDMRLELLEPGGSAASFVQRFLDDNGGDPAPHHITFKVHDIQAAMAGARAAGIEPVLVNTGNPLWREAFLHPRDTGLGFLAQVVQAPGSPEDITEGAGDFTRPCPWDEGESSQAGVPMVFGEVPDLERAAAVLRDVLGAQEYLLDGEPRARGFSWSEGADLLLRESSEPPGASGLKALGIAAAGASRDVRGHHGLLRMLAAGEPCPELGIRLSPLAIPALAIPAPANPG